MHTARFWRAVLLSESSESVMTVRLSFTLFHPLVREVDGKQTAYDRHAEEFDAMRNARIPGKEYHDEKQDTQQHGIAEHLLD